jgi:hypothetical protein
VQPPKNSTDVEHRENYDDHYDSDKNMHNIVEEREDFEDTVKKGSGQENRLGSSGHDDAIDDDFDDDDFDEEVRDKVASGLTGKQTVNVRQSAFGSDFESEEFDDSKKD